MTSTSCPATLRTSAPTIGRDHDMAEVKVEQEIGASADRVWKLMRDFGGLKAWNPGIESCEVEGEGVGAVRTIKMGAISITERLEHLDDAARTYQYSIL